MPTKFFTFIFFKDCHSVLEEDKCEKLGWHLGLEATPRKGRTKELEEESKFRSCKKILFDDATAVSMVNNEERGAESSLNTIAKELHLIQEENNIVADVSEVGNINYDPPATFQQVECSNYPHGGTLSHALAPSSMIPPTSDTFVFKSLKEGKGEKAHSWKRLVRDVGKAQGAPQRMDMDPPDKVNKRSNDHCELVPDEGDGTLKRAKLGPSHEAAQLLLAEVGIDQPRLAL